MRTFEYRLYPTRQQESLLMQCLVESRNLYNEMLGATKKQYEESGKFLFKYDLNKLFAGRSGEHVPASTVQCLADRLDKALRRFLARKEFDEKVGFPRFKKPNQWHSIHLRQFEGVFDFSLDNRYLIVPKKLGRNIKIKMHRPIEGLPKTCHLVLRADRHWYALIVCDVEETKECEDGCKHKEIGIDVGLKTFLTDSDGETVVNPRFFRKAQKTLRIKQRKICRRKKGSKRRQKAARCAAKTHLKIERQRRDFHFKVVKKYVDKFKLIAVEGLNIEGMVKNRCLAKSIMDAGWGQFISILKDKAESAGHQVVEVNPAYTSQECWKCGEIVQKSLSVRTHICPHCGYVADRDVNAAKNILARAKRAGAQPSGVKPSVGKVSLRSRCRKG